jgi:hypothetical protein
MEAFTALPFPAAAWIRTIAVTHVPGVIFTGHAYSLNIIGLFIKDNRI